MRECTMPDPAIIYFSTSPESRLNSFKVPDCEPVYSMAPLGPMTKDLVSCSVLPRGGILIIFSEEMHCTVES
jgi:hypothetical protein